MEIWGKIKTNTRLTGASFRITRAFHSFSTRHPGYLSELFESTNSDGLLVSSMHTVSNTFVQRKNLNVCRLPKWTKDKTLSFVPPDGRFMLMEYRLGTTGTSVASTATIPFSMKSSVELLENSANVDLIFQPKFGSSKGMQSVLIEWYLGKGVTTSSWIPGGGGGTCTFESRTGGSSYRLVLVTC